MSTNYLINLEYEELIKKYNANSVLYFEELKSDVVNTNNYLTVFINISQQSNGFVNFMKDKTIINKYIKIYLLKKTGIEYLYGPLYVDENKINKIYSSFGSIKFDYYTDYYEVIHNYITNNNIYNYLIFY